MSKEKFHPHVGSASDKKSNIYVFVELSRIIQKLDTNKDQLKSTLAEQAVYFHLINPKDLSNSLAPDWIAICHYVGFDGIASISNASKMKTPIREKVSQFTEADIEKFMIMLYTLHARLEAELMEKKQTA
jgi:hypothetical protein